MSTSQIVLMEVVKARVRVVVKEHVAEAAKIVVTDVQELVKETVPVNAKHNVNIKSNN